MAERLQTRPTAASPRAFIAALPDAGRRADAETLCALMAEVSGAPAVMWGPAIVGFGSWRYAYDSGRSGEAPAVAFSPRKAASVLYLSGRFPERAALLERLGKHTTGKACIYIKRLTDVDMAVLRSLIAASLADRKARERG